MTISVENLESFFVDFVAFLKRETGENFKNFRSSDYLNKHENYKYEVSKAAKESLGQKRWKEIHIGTGEIQKSVDSAIQAQVHYNYALHNNNLVDWRKKDSFSKRPISKELEHTLFNFFKSKIIDKKAFEELLRLELSYQFIAYLFFIKEDHRYLPITQKRFDKVFQMIGLHHFKTSGQASWENYQTFISINEQVRDFLKTKDSKASLIDAYSFLYILVSQMKDANFSFSLNRITTISEIHEEQIQVEEIIPATISEQDSFLLEQDGELSFPEGKEIYRLHKSKERNREVIRLAKERHIQGDHKLCCQVCDFSFIDTYGEIGHGFIEAHHIFPISQLKEETVTKIEDLALVCSNCHRMLHRKRPWLTIDDLKLIIELRKSN